jgi:hypothetical protein
MTFSHEESDAERHPGVRHAILAINPLAVDSFL